MYQDLREYLGLLERQGLLMRVGAPVDKDTELHPLVRWQFLGLPDHQRKAFLFDNVVDARGRRYETPVVLGALASNEAIYALGMGCEPGRSFEKWSAAVAAPLAPEVVATGPVKEEIHVGEGLLEHGGLDEFPVPISTPGFDNGPYFTACHWITKDPDTGIRNVGNYRGQIKSPTKTGVYLISAQQDLAVHWNKASALGQPLPAAGVIGAVPCLSYVAVQKIAYGVDELGVAGAILGRPMPLVKCETVDLEVPANAEIVIEGYIRTDVLEPEGPFGESHGYMDPRSLSPVFEGDLHHAPAQPPLRGRPEPGDAQREQQDQAPGLGVAGAGPPAQPLQPQERGAGGHARAAGEPAPVRGGADEARPTSSSPGRP